jgi:hypothetical protein
MISITWVSRNDDHGGSLLARIQASLDSLVHYWETLELDIELIFVEWNPPQGKRLREVLDYPPEFPLWWIEVPNEIHQRFDNSKKFNLWPHIGANVGMRRAKGEWVLTTTHDIIFSELLAKQLQLGLFSHKHFYRAVRVDGHTIYTQRMSTTERISQMQQNIVRRNEHDDQGLFIKACGDFILMPRKTWYELRGYVEWPILGLYFDSILLHSALVSGMGQAIFPHPIYHMEHHSKGQRIRNTLPYMSHGLYKRVCRVMMKQKRPISVNTPSWGLGDWEMEQVGDAAWTLVGGSFPAKLPVWGKWRNL